jgi:D-Tyr-tRNAtyr deacylase
MYLDTLVGATTEAASRVKAAVVVDDATRGWCSRQHIVFIIIMCGPILLSIKKLTKCVLNTNVFSSSRNKKKNADFIEVSFSRG